MNILYKIFRNYIRFLVSILIHVICFLIFLVTYEYGQNKKVTLRKIKRIRFFTKVKIFFFRKTPKLLKFLNYYKKLENINKRYGL